MVSMPYLLLGGLGLLFYCNYRTAQKKTALLAVSRPLHSPEDSVSSDITAAARP
jgi:hypothetical protein